MIELLTGTASMSSTNDFNGYMELGNTVESPTTTTHLAVPPPISTFREQNSANPIRSKTTEFLGYFHILVSYLNAASSSCG
jgi:hypothetical protein